MGLTNYNIPLPRLLNSSGGTARWINPLSVSLNLTITPLSYASMELPVGESVPARSYVELYSPLGSAGIFRVRSPQDAYGEDITTAELEHAIVEVGDYLVLGKYDEMMAAKTAMQTIFSHYRGSRWQLGSVSAMGSTQIAVQADHVRVLEAMLGLLDQCPDCMMKFDFTTSPWTVSVVARGSTVAAEGRLSRNVNAAKVIYDDTELVTRVYYEHSVDTNAGTNNFPVFDASQRYGKGTYLAHSGKLYKLTADHAKDVTWANTSKELMDDYPSSTWAYKDTGTQSKYGHIERTISTGNNYTAAEAEATVDKYIAKHKEPRVSVEISAEELSQVTGEAWDTFSIGKLFRLSLADYNVTVELNITGLSWSNVYDMPENVVVNLADEEDTAITFLHDVDQKGGSGGGGGGKKKQDDVWKEYRTRFEQDDYHFNLVAERVNKAEEVLQQAGLYIDSNGVLIYAEDNESNLGARLKVQADKIAMVVGTRDGNNYIKAAEIAVAINEAGEGLAIINANHINISATNTAHMLAGSIVYDSNGRLVLKDSSGGGIYTERTSGQTTTTFGIWDKGNLTGGVMVQQINGQTAIKISGDVIDINGSSIIIKAARIDIDGILNAIYQDSKTIRAVELAATSQFDSPHIHDEGSVLRFAGSSWGFGTGHSASWQATEVVTDVTPTKTTSKSWALSDGTSWIGQLMTSVSLTKATIHYLGEAST